MPFLGIKNIGLLLAVVSLIGAGWFVRDLISDKAALKKELASANERAELNYRAAEQWQEQAQKLRELHAFVAEQTKADRAYFDGVYYAINEKFSEASAELRACLGVSVPGPVLERMRESSRHANGTDSSG